MLKSKESEMDKQREGKPDSRAKSAVFNDLGQSGWSSDLRLHTGAFLDGCYPD